MATISILDLPDDVFREIFTELEMSDHERFFDFALVCRFFHRLAFALPFDESLSLSSNGPLNSKLEDLIDNVAKSLRDGFVSEEAADAALVEGARARFETTPFFRTANKFAVVALAASDAPSCLLPLLAELFPATESLYFEAVNAYLKMTKEEDEDGPTSPARKLHEVSFLGFSNLKSLTIGEILSFKKLHLPKSLLSLKISADADDVQYAPEVGEDIAGCTNLSTLRANFSIPLQSFRKLVALKLKIQSRRDSENLERLSSEVLEQLELQFERNAPDLFCFPKLSKFGKSLRTLVIKKSIPIPNECVEGLELTGLQLYSSNYHHLLLPFATQKKLRTLSIFRSDMFPSNEIQIIANLSSLTELSLHGTIRFESMRYLFPRFGSLRRLILDIRASPQNPYHEQNLQEIITHCSLDNLLHLGFQNTPISLPVIQSIGRFNNLRSLSLSSGLHKVAEFCPTVGLSRLRAAEIFSRRMIGSPTSENCHSETLH